MRPLEKLTLIITFIILSTLCIKSVSYAAFGATTNLGFAGKSDGFTWGIDLGGTTTIFNQFVPVIFEIWINSVPSSQDSSTSSTFLYSTQRLS